MLSMSSLYDRIRPAGLLILKSHAIFSCLPVEIDFFRLMTSTFFCHESQTLVLSSNRDYLDETEMASFNFFLISLKIMHDVNRWKWNG